MLCWWWLWKLGTLLGSIWQFYLLRCYVDFARTEKFEKDCYGWCMSCIFCVFCLGWVCFVFVQPGAIYLKTTSPLLCKQSYNGHVQKNKFSTGMMGILLLVMNLWYFIIIYGRQHSFWDRLSQNCDGSVKWKITSMNQIFSEFFLS